MLDVKSTNRGLLIPRIPTGGRNAIPSPATGLIIYNSETRRFEYFNGTFWYQVQASFISSTTGTFGAEGVVSFSASTTAEPEHSTILDINNPTRGILVPRTEPDLITAPATGLIVYNTISNRLTYYNGIQWETLCAVSTGIGGANGSQDAVGVAINSDNSPPHHSAILDVTAASKGVLIPRLTNSERDSILPIPGLAIYNISANDMEFYDGSAWYRLETDLPVVTTTAPSNITSSTALSGGNVISDCGTPVSERGVCWSTSLNPTFTDSHTIDESGTGTFTSTISGLDTGTTYYVRSYATNSFGSAYGNQVTVTTSPGPGKLALNPGMLYNFSTRGDAGLLVDEQLIAGDPATGHGGNPVTVFTPGWYSVDIYYPARVVLDLGKSCNLTSLWLYDTNDIDSIFIYAGDPSSWQKKAGIFLDLFNTWREVPIQAKTRFLMFSYPSPHTLVGEIVLYGEAAGAPVPPPLPVQRPRPFIDQFMGVNGFVDDPVDKLGCTGNVREYHNWEWDEGNLDTTYPGYPNNQYAWNPSWVSGPGWAFNFDNFYQQLKSNGLNAGPDLQGCAPYIVGFDFSKLQYKPLGVNEDPLSPMSYPGHSDYMFQFAARFGSTAVTPSLLKLRPDQALISGSGLVRYIENWNEPDKWWASRNGYFAPDEFSAMCSADCDGHENSMGTGKGMKAADPTVKMVMGGLASLNLEYLRCMNLWSEFNRQTGFPADVLNFHHYSQNSTHGISPEDDGLKDKLKSIASFRDTCMPGKEIWLTEFGYDTNPASEQAAIAIDTNDIYEVQAEWIMRSFLEAAAAGLDKAFVFMLRDVNAPDPTKYNSSGLTNEKWNGYQPKKSWIYVSTMKSQLKGLRFDKEIASGQNPVNVYSFHSVTGDTTVYTVWCGSSSNTIIENFTLNVGAATSAQLILPMAGMPEGSLSAISIENNTVTFRVTERPVFIRTRQ